MALLYRCFSSAVKRTPDPPMTSYAPDRACSDFKTWRVSGFARSSFRRASSHTTGMKPSTLDVLQDRKLLVALGQVLPLHVS